MDKSSREKGRPMSRQLLYSTGTVQYTLCLLFSVGPYHIIVKQPSLALY
jgi:hypothetical protein